VEVDVSNYVEHSVNFTMEVVFLSTETNKVRIAFYLRLTPLVKINVNVANTVFLGFV